MINKNLGLSMVGGTSGIFSARSLFVHNNIEENRLNVYLKNTKLNNSGRLKSETNWNMNTLSPDLVCKTYPARFEYSMTDYSSNKYDMYYDSNKGNSPTTYSITSDWSVNDIAVQKNLMAVAYKDWTSVEKYTTELDDKVIECYISPINYYYSSSSTQTYTLYEVRVNWASQSPNCLTTGGTLTIEYDYGTEIRTVDVAIPASPVPAGSGIQTIYTTSSTVRLSYTNPDGWLTNPMGCVTQSVYSTSTVDITTTVPPPLGSIARNNGYIIPSELDPKLTHFLLPVTIERFQDQDFSWMNFDQPNAFEVPDYSDIFFDITYDYNTGPNSDYLYEITSQGDQRKVYSFGGFIKFTDFVNGLLDKAVVGDKLNIIDDNEFKWYIIVKSDGQYYSVGLSHYVTWDYTYSTSYPYPESGMLGFDAYEVIDYRFISVQSVKLVKTAVFPKCGKVDIFSPAKGIVQSFSGNQIISSGHRLSTGDQIKIAGGRGNGSNINGLRYVQVIDSNTFSIFYDMERVYPCSIVNTLSGDIEWKSINKSSWKYLTSIYSPMGKNGYSLSPSLNSVNESPSFSGHLIDIAQESSTNKPQADTRGLISWNNYYPFERFGENEDVIYGIVNGNKFGSAVEIQPYNDGYIIGISETGAAESFPIVSEYETSTEEYKPKNKRLAPYYFPYGRVHFFWSDSSFNISYLGSYNREDNPWIAYESANRSDKLYGGSYHSNIPITQSQLEQYQTSTNDYWFGAKIIHWSQSYYYDTSFRFDLPSQSSNWNYYGYIDEFGSDISFNISGDTIDSIILTRSKNLGYSFDYVAGTYCNLRINTSFNTGTRSVNYNSIDSASMSNSVEEQKQKFANLNKVISLQDKNIICWAGVNTVFVNTSAVQRIFQEVVDCAAYGDLLVINSGQSLDVYHNIGGSYQYVSFLSGTFTDYDIYKDMLIVKNSADYSGYMYNRILESYEWNFSKENMVGVGPIKISPGNSPSFFDTNIEYDIGDIHSSLNVISIGTDGLYNYVAGLDVQDMEYLPLVIKTNDFKSSSINLNQLGGGSSGSGMELFLSPITPVPSSINLVIKQLDSVGGNAQLFTCQANIYESGSLNLFVGSNNSKGIPLVNKGYSPLVGYKDEDANLYISNSHPNAIVYPPPYSGIGIVPDNYGLFPIFMPAQSSMSDSGNLPLFIGYSVSGAQNSLSMYQNAFNNFKTINISMPSSGYGYSGKGQSGIPLYLGRQPESYVPLIVYNTTTIGNVPLNISGGQISNSGIQLSMSGYHKPNSTLNTYVRGAL